MKQQLVPHRHFVGAAHSFEIVKATDETAGKYVRPDVTIVKTFFINDEININDWQATWEGLKLDAQELPGVPLVLQEDLQHPKFSVQDLYDRGTIFDYDIDEEKKQIIVYVRITDPKITARIKSGELQYVSPAVIPRGDESMSKINGVDVLHRTLPLHLAIVGDPAYGKEKAKMSHMCSGDGEECYHRLKTMTASKKFRAEEEEEKEKERKQREADAIDSLTQIPLIKKMLAKSARIASTLQKRQDGTELFPHNGKMGRWIHAKDTDVFVAENQPLEEAIKKQCGCTKLIIS